MERIELKVHPDLLLDPAGLEAALRAQAPASSSSAPLRIVHRGIDARKGRVRVLIKAEVGGETPPLLANPPPALALRPVEPVVIVGAGPAGLFCALELARAGLPSIVLERGKAVRERRRDLAALTRHGELNPESNYCFGEGGAGTFSDGKLYTRAKKRGDVQQVLADFVAHGASPDILVDARPHIGTNRLPKVIGSLRAFLEESGVQFRFDTRVTGLTMAGAASSPGLANPGGATSSPASANSPGSTASQVRGVQLADGATLPAKKVVLCPGHSARDVPDWLLRAGVRLVFKPFALGVRIEHPQEWIDRQQYGDLAGHPALGAAPYRLVENVDERSVFSFCMCPGGFIAPASTNEGAQVVNGWSPSSRNGRFANSGFVVEVGERELAARGLDPDDPVSGVRFQEYFEEKAFEAGGGAFAGPAQRLDDFRAGRLSSSLNDCSYPRPLRSARLDQLLEDLAAPLIRALERLDRKMPGFAGPHALAVGVESRTSCPYRIERDHPSFEAVGVHGLYPCGEGAGYAGGIMSAALDGIRVARAIATQAN